MFEEPPWIKEFRAGFPDSFGLAQFSWVPQDGNREQEIFIRRTVDVETGGMGIELIVWSKVSGTYEHVVFEAAAFRLMLSVAGDLFTKPKGQKWYQTGSLEDEKIMRSRTAVDEDGRPEDYLLLGKWYKQESALAKFKRAAKDSARAIKGAGEGGQAMT